MTPSTQGHKVSIQTKQFSDGKLQRNLFQSNSLVHIIFTIYERNLHTNETELINR